MKPETWNLKHGIIQDTDLKFNNKKFIFIIHHSLIIHFAFCIIHFNIPNS